MNAPDPALMQKFQEADRLEDQDKPVDLVFVLRGGATDVYTLISNLRALQERIPHYHLSHTNPYILADSAGAYPAAGLVGPNPIDPFDLPAIFRRNISSYLSRNRAEAEDALRQDVGDILVRDSSIPVTISSVEFTHEFLPTYFTNFPEKYAAERPGFVSPPNQNDDTKLTQAVMASSAFPLVLGEYKIGERRFMDMAFLETHSDNLLDYYIAHRTTRPERRVVCVIFGNNYADFTIGKNEELQLSYLKRHFGSAVRLRAQHSILTHASKLFGQENVFDLSLYVKQPFSERDRGPASNAFRRDDLAIRERIAWTEAMLRNSLYHKETLDRLAAVIKRSALPQTSIAPAIAQSAIDASALIMPLTPREERISRIQELGPAAELVLTVAGETIMPLVERTKPVVEAGLKVAHASTQAAGEWLGTQWATNLRPWLERQGQSLDRKLLPNNQRPVRPLLPNHSSEPHTPPESDYTPL